MVPRPLRELLEAKEKLEAELAAVEEEIGPAVRAARLSSGTSQSAFAHAIGVSQPYLSMIENREKTPTTSTLRRVAERSTNDTFNTEGRAQKDARKARD